MPEVQKLIVHHKFDSSGKLPVQEKGKRIAGEADQPKI
jgi:hypothetical protein